VNNPKVQEFINSSSEPSLPTSHATSTLPAAGLTQVLGAGDASVRGSATSELPASEGIDLVLATRIIRHLLSTSEEDRSKAYKQGSAKVFTYLCDTVEVEYPNSKNTKRSLFNLVSLC
jgi:hypothetical protein